MIKGGKRMDCHKEKTKKHWKKYKDGTDGHKKREKKCHKNSISLFTNDRLLDQRSIFFLDQRKDNRLKGFYYIH